MREDVVPLQHYQNIALSRDEFLNILSLKELLTETSRKKSLTHEFHEKKGIRD